jgi:hypothetical protein
MPQYRPTAAELVAHTIASSVDPPRGETRYVLDCFEGVWVYFLGGTHTTEDGWSWWESHWVFEDGEVIIGGHRP